jgi:transcriptional regulator NrdR family protein
MKIVKASGAIVDFDATKLKKSLTKSGATDSVVDAIFETIQNQAYDGITTKEIYKMAFVLLKKASHSHAARYNLRTSIQMLGPAGFFLKNI